MKWNIDYLTGQYARAVHIKQVTRFLQFARCVSDLLLVILVVVITRSQTDFLIFTFQRRYIVVLVYSGQKHCLSLHV